MQSTKSPLFLGLAMQYLAGEAIYNITGMVVVVHRLINSIGYLMGSIVSDVPIKIEAGQSNINKCGARFSSCGCNAGFAIIDDRKHGYTI